MKIKTFNIVLPLSIKKGLILFVIVIGLGAPAYCQTLYVDAAKGRNGAKGTVDAPLASLEEAVRRTHDFKGNQPVVIRLNPGLYVIKNKLDIKTAGGTGNNQPYNIEAVIMPGAAGYEPYKMPVIQSVCGTNDTLQFPHCEALLVEKNNVHIAGIKFVGNPNPEVHTYYPIRRADKTLKGLSVSQCYFIGEKNSSAI
ncbi:hypothetical protein, partial [Pedobacter sp. L105]|uniref:hypothetical protein n=1 Tax=Pedobacter sp. L105 TaxID=1641871 RepID=UPI00131AA4FB